MTFLNLIQKVTYSSHILYQKSHIICAAYTIQYYCTRVFYMLLPLEGKLPARGFFFVQSEGLQ